MAQKRHFRRRVVASDLPRQADNLTIRSHVALGLNRQTYPRQRKASPPYRREIGLLS
jgi:hypothetical protein